MPDHLLYRSRYKSRIIRHWGANSARVTDINSLMVV